MFDFQLLIILEKQFQSWFFRFVVMIDSIQFVKIMNDMRIAVIRIVIVDFFIIYLKKTRLFILVENDCCWLEIFNQHVITKQIYIIFRLLTLCRKFFVNLSYLFKSSITVLIFVVINDFCKQTWWLNFREFCVTSVLCVRTLVGVWTLILSHRDPGPDPAMTKPPAYALPGPHS